MLIDKKGRIFGKVNIIDLFVILAVVAVALYFAVKKIPTIVDTATDTVIITFYSYDALNYVAENVKIGDKVEDEGKYLNLGTITSFEVSEGYVYGFNSDGESIKSTRDDLRSIKITTEIKGQLTDSGVIIGGNKYSLGHGLTARAGMGKIYCRVVDIQKK